MKMILIKLRILFAL